MVKHSLILSLCVRRVAFVSSAATSKTPKDKAVRRYGQRCVPFSPTSQRLQLPLDVCNIKSMRFYYTRNLQSFPLRQAILRGGIVVEFGKITQREQGPCVNSLISSITRWIKDKVASKLICQRDTPFPEASAGRSCVLLAAVWLQLHSWVEIKPWLRVHCFHRPRLYRYTYFILRWDIRGLCLCHLNQSLRPCVECIFILSPHISMQTKYKAMRIFRHLTDTSESDLST